MGVLIAMISIRFVTWIFRKLRLRGILVLILIFLTLTGAIDPSYLILGIVSYFVWGMIKKKKAGKGKSPA